MPSSSAPPGPAPSAPPDKAKAIEQKLLQLLKKFFARVNEDKDKKFKEIENDPEKKRGLQELSKKHLEHVNEQELLRELEVVKTGAEVFKRSTPMIIIKVLRLAPSGPEENRQPLKWTEHFVSREGGQTISRDGQHEQSDNEPQFIKIRNLPKEAWGNILVLTIENHLIVNVQPGNLVAPLDHIKIPLPQLHYNLPVELPEVITITGGTASPTGGNEPPTQANIDNETHRGPDSSAAWAFDDDSTEGKHLKEALQEIYDMLEKKKPNVVHIFENEAEVRDAITAINNFTYDTFDGDAKMIRLVVEGFNDPEKRKEVFAKGWTTGMVKQAAGHLLAVWAHIREKKLQARRG